MSVQGRQPAGDPHGGEFAPFSRNEPEGVDLTPPVSSLDADVDHAKAVFKGAQREVGSAEFAHNRASKDLMAASDAMNAGPFPNAETSTSHRERYEDAVAVEAAAREQVEHAKWRLGRARDDLTAAQARYPWAGTDTPVIELYGGQTRPVTVAPSGEYGFYESPRFHFLGSGRCVAIAQNINGTWHPTGGPFSEDTIRVHNPEYGLAIDAGQEWRITSADAAEFVRFANQEALR